MGKLRPYQQKLVDEARNSLARGNSHILVQSPAGSGKTVTMAEIARLSTLSGNRVLFTVHRREIVQQVVKTFTAWGVDMDLCTIGMVQALSKVRQLNKLETPQLILCDEAHHSLAATYKRIFEHFSDAKLIGFTATPARLSGKGMKDVYDDLIIGPKIKWLIDNDFLAPFDYYAPTLIDVEKLKRSSTGDYSNKSMDDTVKVRAIFGDVLATYKRVADNTKTIVYTHNVQSSVDVAEAFIRAGYPTQHVDGKTPEDERKQAMKNFRSGKTLILVNAELYGEGVDVPDCQTVIMLRPTDSLTLYIQQSMRCMRYQPNKRAVIIDHVANAYRFGLPDAEREWTLEDREKSKKSGKSTGPAITTCPQCFAVIPAGYSKCPICGSEIKTAQKEIEVDESAKLEKVEGFSLMAEYAMARFARTDPKDITNPKDMYKLAEARGYDPKWAWHQCVARGWLKKKKRRA